MPVKQFGFAWLSDEFETFSGSLFRNDEQWTAFKVSGSEGDCDGLDITIKNPRRGLLNGPIWACMSYGTSSGDAVEIFRGRLTGIPSSIIGETVDLLFIAKPSSYDAQLAILAAGLRALPPYDCIWIDPTNRADPMAVLECLSALYYVDRVTHAMQITDIIQGEDGIVDITADDILYDSLDCGSAGDPPITAVTMIGHVNWTQAATGVGFQVPNAYCSKVTLSGDSLVQSWPKTGDTIGGGYVVTDGFCNDVLGLSFKQPVQKSWSYENRAKEHTVGDVMSSSLSYTLFPANGHSFISNINTQTGLVPSGSTVAYEDLDPESANGRYSSYDPYASIDGATMGSDPVMIPMHVSYNVIFIPNWLIEFGLSLSIDSGAQAAETIQFTVAADLQPVVILPDPTVVQQTIELSTQDLTTDADAGDPAGGGTAPPLDPSSDAFAATDRGATSIGYMVAVARATIRKASRATSCVGTVTFEKALAFTLRKNARVQDVRLPGGEVEGKITAYTFGFDGAVATGTFEILPAVGNVADPNIVAGAAGANSYATDYVDTYTATAGGVQLIPGVGAAGDIGYTIDPYTAAGISALTAAECVVASEWQTGLVTVQVGSDDLQGGGTRTYFTDAVTDKFHLELVPTNNINLAADVPVVTTPLNIPKQIDLSAAPL